MRSLEVRSLAQGVSMMIIPCHHHRGVIQLFGDVQLPNTRHYGKVQRQILGQLRDLKAKGTFFRPETFFISSSDQFWFDEWSEGFHCSSEHLKNGLKPIEKRIHGSERIGVEKFLRRIVQERMKSVDQSRIFEGQTKRRRFIRIRRAKTFVVVRRQFQREQKVENATHRVNVRLEQKFVRLHLENKRKNVVQLKDFEEFVHDHRRRRTGTDREMSNDGRRRRRRKV